MKPNPEIKLVKDHICPHMQAWVLAVCWRSGLRWPCRLTHGADTPFGNEWIRISQ